MKLACQEGMAPGASLAEKLDNLASAGYEGIEFSGSKLPDRVAEIQRATATHAVKPSSICAGYRGCPLDASRQEREQASADIVRLLEAAGEIGAVGLIMVPVFGDPRLPDLSPLASARKLELDLLDAVCGTWADAAEKAGVSLLIEPLNRYETHLLNTLDDAAAVCRRSGRAGLRIMADFFHMSIEEASMPAAIRAAGNHVAHVHLADSNRQLPGEGHTDFAAGFAALRDIGFSGYMALECGNPHEDRLAGLRACAQFLRAAMAAGS